MSKKAILFSAQNFPPQVKHRLNGCINDTKIWKKTLKSLGFTLDDSNIYHNETKDTALKKINSFITKLKANETGVIFFSGHGIRKDYRKANGYFEGIIFNYLNIMYDYDILLEIQKLKDKPDSKLILIADSCHSQGLPSLKRFVLHNAFDVFSTYKNYDPSSAIALKYEHNVNGIKERFTLNVSAEIVYSDTSNIVENIYISETILNKSLQREKVLKEIEEYIAQPTDEFPNINNIENCLIYSEEPEDKNLQQINGRGLTNTISHKNEPNPPKRKLIKISELPNVTYILAEEDTSQKAYEKYFNTDNTFEAGHYGIFSYYATKAILANPYITYNKLRETVNNNIYTNEDDESVKAQKMNFVSGNKDGNRKVFT